MDIKGFKLDYIDANIPKLPLWLMNGSYPLLGIDYTTNGFAQTAYYTEQMKNIAERIIIQGNYSVN